MKEIVSAENIKAKVNVKDWKDAIRAAGDILVSKGKIKKNYVECMIDAVTEMGPYMVLTPGFALAHARPSEDVLENGVSLITLKNPVNFGSKNDPVNVILCIACTDNKSHIDTLQAVAEKLMAEGMIGKLASCENEQEIYSLING